MMSTLMEAPENPPLHDLHLVIKSQFEDFCSSVRDQSETMMANVLEGCLIMSDRILNGRDARSKSLLKLHLSNTINDVHFSCIKQFESLVESFFDKIDMPRDRIPCDLARSRSVVHLLLASLEDESSKMATPHFQPCAEKKTKMRSFPSDQDTMKIGRISSDDVVVEKCRMQLEDRLSNTSSQMLSSSKSSSHIEPANQRKSSLFPLNSSSAMPQPFFTNLDQIIHKDPPLYSHPSNYNNELSKRSYENDKAIIGEEISKSQEGNQMYALFRKHSSKNGKKSTTSRSNTSSHSSSDCRDYYEETASLNGQYRSVIIQN